MMIAPIPAAASPLPQAALAGTAVPKDMAPFETTLAATLDDGARSAPAEGVRQFADPLALAEWLLVGMPAPAAEQVPQAAPAVVDAPDLETDEALDLAAQEGSAWWEIPADALLAASAVAADAAAQHATADGQIVPEATLKNAPAATLQNAPTDSGANAQPVMTVATGQTLGSAPAPAPALTPDDVTTTEPSPFAAPAKPTVTPVEKADVAPKATAPAAPALPAEIVPPSMTEAPVETNTGVAVKAEQPVAAERTPVVMERPPAAEITKAVPAAPMTGSTDARAAIEIATPAATAVEGRSERAPREANAQAASLQARLGMDTLNGQSTSGNMDGEQDARRSFAGQRLAAALTMQAPVSAESTPAASTFTATASPAPAVTAPVVAAPAAVAPVAAPMPVFATPMTTAPPDVENVAALVEAMRMTAKGGGWEATVRLKPQHFGEVTIQLKVEGNSVSATVNAESAGVRQWLLAQEESVRSGMAEHGLQLDRFQVSRDGQRREAEEQSQQHQQQPRRRMTPRGADEPEPRFEIVV